MKAAPIILTEYFVTDMHISANIKFDPKQESPVLFKDFQVEFGATPEPKDQRAWQLNLKIQLQPAAEANVPYRVLLDMVGFVKVHPDVKDDFIERLVTTNGASMLFGAAREIIRDATARGPWAQLFIPSTSFYGPQDEKTDAAATLPPHP